MTGQAELVADAGTVWSIINGCAAYFGTCAAARLGVFEALTSGPLSAPEIAGRCAADPERLAVLCDVLVGLELLDREGDRYALTSTASAFLLRESPRSMHDLLFQSPGPWENWPGLDATVRGEPPVHPVDAEFYAGLGRATFPTQLRVAEGTAALAGPVRRILDLGAGAGPWTIALLRANPRARATVNDFEPVLRLAREQLRAAGVDDRCELLPGDYFDVDLDASFDAVVLAHVLRAEGRARAPELLARAVNALVPGGVIVVADYFVDDDHRGPLNALLLGATMLASTTTGATFTFAEYQRWLSDAGIADVRLAQPIPFQTVMLGRKPGGSS